MGTAIEWYDYGLYTIAAGLVISTVFFSGESEQVALLATYGAFAVGFVARPLGGIVLGAASDRFGRRPVLIFSLLLIGSATTIIGLLPGYDSIGIWAPLLLMLMRIVQGFAAGRRDGGRDHHRQRERDRPAQVVPVILGDGRRGRGRAHGLGPLLFVQFPASVR
nr:MFS transporter [Actinomadura madurae]